MGERAFSRRKFIEYGFKLAGGAAATFAASKGLKFLEKAGDGKAEVNEQSLSPMKSAETVDASQAMEHAEREEADKLRQKTLGQMFGLFAESEWGAGKQSTINTMAATYLQSRQELRRMIERLRAIPARTWSRVRKTDAFRQQSFFIHEGNRLYLEGLKDTKTYQRMAEQMRPAVLKAEILRLAHALHKELPGGMLKSNEIDFELARVLLSEVDREHFEDIFIVISALQERMNDANGQIDHARGIGVEKLQTLVRGPYEREPGAQNQGRGRQFGDNAMIPNELRSFGVEEKFSHALESCMCPEDGKLRFQIKKKEDYRTLVKTVLLFVNSKADKFWNHHPVIRKLGVENYIHGPTQEAGWRGELSEGVFSDTPTKITEFSTGFHEKELLVMSQFPPGFNPDHRVLTTTTLDNIKRRNARSGVSPDSIPIFVNTLPLQLEEIANRHSSKSPPV